MRKYQKKQQWADHYTQKARKEDFPARSVYKLQEIQQKFNLIKPRTRVLDLGCAPGSWLKYVADIVGPDGMLIGIDLNSVTISLPEWVDVITGDVNDLIRDTSNSGKFTGLDLILSDMAPATSGNKFVDVSRSIALCETAYEIAKKGLRPGGAFVCKIFQGDGFESFTRYIRPAFEQYKHFKPQSCRKQSKEVYIIGMNKKEEC